MKRYRVGLTQTVYEEATIVVEADSPEAAEEEAIRRVLEGEVEWRFLDAVDGPEIASTDEVK